MRNFLVKIVCFVVFFATIFSVGVQPAFGRIPVTCENAGDTFEINGTCYYCNQKGDRPVEVDCASPGSGSSGVLSSDGVSIEVEDESWLKEVFGDSLKLNIFNPTGDLFSSKAEVTVWVVAALLVEIAFYILFIVMIVAILIGVIKWISSQGKEDKLVGAQKWVKNPLIAFGATIGMFLLINIITWFMGAGSIFTLAENLSVCGDEVLYQYKQDAGLTGDYYCTCNADSWSCTLRDSDT